MLKTTQNHQNPVKCRKRAQFSCFARNWALTLPGGVPRGLPSIWGRWVPRRRHPGSGSVRTPSSAGKKRLISPLSGGVGDQHLDRLWICFDYSRCDDCGASVRETVETNRWSAMFKYVTGKKLIIINSFVDLSH